MPTPTDLAEARRAALGQRVRALRKRAKLTQAELAAAAGLDRSFLALVENARHSISLERLLSVADALGVTIHELLPSDEDALAAVGAARDLPPIRRGAADNGR